MRKCSFVRGWLAQDLHLWGHSIILGIDIDMAEDSEVLHGFERVTVAVSFLKGLQVLLKVFQREPLF